MNVLNDYVVVKVDSELNTFAGLVYDENGKEVQLVLNPHFQPTHHSKICAEVIGVPRYLTGKDNPLYEIYQGAPRATTFRGHDYIQAVTNAILPKYRKTNKITYSCGTYQPIMQTHKDLPIEVKVGDKVYFHYNSLLNEENYMFRDEDGMLVYKILYSNLFCYVRDHDITMLNSFVLVQEAYAEDVTDIEVDGQTIKAKEKDGLIVSVGEKPLFLSGVLRFIGKGIGPDVRSVKPGTMVMFRPKSEFINMIEGEAYYVMRQWDLIAEWIDDKERRDILLALPEGVEYAKHDWISPLGDYLMVVPDKIETKQKTVIYDPSAPAQDFKPGEIFVLDVSVKNDRKKKNYVYGIGKVISSGELCGQSMINKKVYYEKSSYYVWVEEYKVAFVRSGDVYGETTENDNQIVVEKT